LLVLGLEESLWRENRNVTNVSMSRRIRKPCTNMCTNTPPSPTTLPIHPRQSWDHSLAAWVLWCLQKGMHAQLAPNRTGDIKEKTQRASKCAQLNHTRPYEYTIRQENTRICAPFFIPGVTGVYVYTTSVFLASLASSALLFLATGCNATIQRRDTRDYECESCQCKAKHGYA
jgi:hypothetical protein